MSKLPPIVRTLIFIDLGVTLLVLVVAGVGWLIGWRTATEFSNGFFILGAVVAVFGAYSALGGFGMRGNPGVNFAQTASLASLEERNKRMLADMMQGTNTAYIATGIGLLLIGVAVLIPILFG